MPNITSMREMWTFLDAFTIASDGRERAVNQANEWGGMSRRLSMPVFTAWSDYTTYNKEAKTTRAQVGNSALQTSRVGTSNQEFWIAKAFEEHNGQAAFFVIHARDPEAHPRKVEEIESHRIFVGQLERDNEFTYLVAQPRQL
ncbi:hypothetical protein J2W32_001461 [Variovorax boronicumulans]|uniref:Uncharacterized protein n=1 Tax=Variovorax boronicumulans TaxID=436515 RepID=A0AAW8CWB8_9BURK|nr:hypothetical protein [Variovorax boronicumulans]MDP9893237.1 hypothetical protein [Variovorax boronicumulans]MDQ0052419.1 hypothetical protein [Variovorax boronicumulans]